MSMKPVTYALLTAVGNYDPKLELTDLGSSGRDLEIMTGALTRGLRLDADNIRRLGEDGTVSAMSFARSIAEFDSMLTEEDTFIFYFSGHGQNKELMFSDGGITISSIVDFVRKLPAKQKLVILDCCYSGQAHPGEMEMYPQKDSLPAGTEMEDQVSAFAGT